MVANLHNAKANSGIVNIVGQHAVYHIGYNAPLTSDIEAGAADVGLVRTSRTPSPSPKTARRRLRPPRVRRPDATSSCPPIRLNEAMASAGAGGIQRAVTRRRRWRMREGLRGVRRRCCW